MVELIYTGPTSTTAERSDLRIINSLIAANVLMPLPVIPQSDADALVSILEKKPTNVAIKSHFLGTLVFGKEARQNPI